MLLACFDPNGTSHGVFPLCEALRCVSVFLQYRANPNRHEVRHTAPVFIALGDEVLPCAQLLLEHKAGVDVLETYTSSRAPAVHRQHVSTLPRRTTFEVAAHNPDILLMLQEALNPP